MPQFKENLSFPTSDEIYSLITALCETPHRRSGTPEGHRAEQWVETKFKELGLEHVSVDPIPITVWNASNWELRVENRKIPSFFIVNTEFTDSEGIRAPLVYVGKGTHKNFKKVDVEGKIVVADVPFPYIPTGLLMTFLKLLGATYIISDPGQNLTFKSGQYLNFVRENFIGGSTLENARPDDVYWRAFREGAKAICLILEDQPSNSNSHYGPYDGIMKPMPGLWIGKYDGIQVRDFATKGLEAQLVLEGNKAPGTMSNIWGILPGMSDETILVTSHHDAPFKGAVEDGAGVAQVLAQIKVWSSLPKEKRAKSLVFVVNSGHFYGSVGGSSFALLHPEIMDRTKLLITLEHLGAKEVIEENKNYVETGNIALTVMFTSSEPLTIATVINALEKKPAKMTIPIPSNLFAPVPVSDAGGYVYESGVPVISWIGCPYYLLDEYDTLDKVAKDELRPLCETITELIKPHMHLK